MILTIYIKVDNYSNVVITSIKFDNNNKKTN